MAWFNVFYDFNFSISDKRFVSFFYNSTVNVQYYEIRNLLQSSCSDIVTRSASCPPYPHSAHRVKKLILKDSYFLQCLFYEHSTSKKSQIMTLACVNTATSGSSLLADWDVSGGEDKSMIPAVRRLGMREGCILAQAMHFVYVQSLQIICTDSGLVGI